VHEVKMPLANISLPAELTFMDVRDVEEGKKGAAEVLPRIKRRMKYIMEQASQAGQKVDAVRKATERRERGRDAVNMAEVVRNSVAPLSELLRRTQARVDVTLDGPVAAVGDAKQLEIVFTNLIKNAVEAMAEAPGNGLRYVRITAQKEADRIVFQVQDTGPGIDQTHLPYLFKPHYSTKGANGAGMGLFLCRQIIEAHGGNIDVESTPEGALFRITLCSPEISPPPEAQA
jgi:signal transduction histidine kinase